MEEMRYLSDIFSLREHIQEYQQLRAERNHGRFCHAPFRNMFVAFNGDVFACCANRTYVLGKFPEKSLKEIWSGAAINKLRDAILRGDLSLGCEQCYNNLENKEFSIIPSIDFDKLSDQPVPSRLDLNLSISCNLECIMCNEWSSSSIRKSKKLQPVPEIFDDVFLLQVDELIPYLEKMFYIGGEPFVINSFFKIWSKVVDTKPAIENIVQTNGTVLNERIKSLLEKGNFSFNISIDSIRKKTFEKIRKNADFEKTMENLAYFIDYARRKGTYVNLTVCPLQQNWEEIPELVRFAYDNEISIYFNTILDPDECSFFGFPGHKLEEIHDYYSSFVFTEKNITEKVSKSSFLTLISQVKNFYTDRANIPREKIIRIQYEKQKGEFEKQKGEFEKLQKGEFEKLQKERAARYENLKAKWEMSPDNGKKDENNLNYSFLIDLVLQETQECILTEYRYSEEQMAETKFIMKTKLKRIRSLVSAEDFQIMIRDVFINNSVQSMVQDLTNRTAENLIERYRELKAQGYFKYPQ